MVRRCGNGRDQRCDLDAALADGQRVKEAIERIAAVTNVITKPTTT